VASELKNAVLRESLDFVEAERKELEEQNRKLWETLRQVERDLKSKDRTPTQ
jgi:hypothetical protein